MSTEPAELTISVDVAEFLIGVVYSIPLNAGREDFDQLLPLVLKAREQLESIITAAAA